MSSCFYFLDCYTFSQLLIDIEHFRDYVVDTPNSDVSLLRVVVVARLFSYLPELNLWNMPLMSCVTVDVYTQRDFLILILIFKINFLK